MRKQSESPFQTVKAYTKAGVDVDLGNSLKNRIQDIAGRTHGTRVLGKIGGFGGFFRAVFPGIKDPVLVASIDGVGTKLKMAFDAPSGLKAHSSVARDLVNHCVNDIAVTGAVPLFFLDYIGAERLDPSVFKQLLSGFASACKAAGCALLGGETAQMPGMYSRGEYDLAGCIIGVAGRRQIVDGTRIKPGDVIVGLASDGLHTNGYSLARRALFDKGGYHPEQTPPGWKRTLREELLRPHRCYLHALQNCMGLFKGAVHVTGGGLVDNFPRILPEKMDALIDTSRWRVPAIFELIGHLASVPTEEMYQVFNMGIGMALVVSEKDASEVQRRTRGKVIGRIEVGSRRVRLE